MSKKLFLTASVVFSILTFIGAGYVLIAKGQANAGYAVIPMLCTLALIAMYRSKSK